jgi:protein SMG6
MSYLRLAEMMRNLLEISLAPSVPASLRNIPRKYNIITRLWTYGFHKLLESLRRAACNVPRDAVAFEHLQEFIYFAYTFYTHMLEERSLDEYESYWLEALGDLARYRMNVAAMAASIYLPSSGVSAAAFLSNNRPSSGGGGDDDAMSAASFASHAQQARIDDSPVPSVGVAAARLLESEPEKERWRQIAREWYSSGVAATPGAGKLHHHLGLLSREREGEELRGIYHFTKRLAFL